MVRSRQGPGWRGWCGKAHPADADRIAAFGLSGEVYVSEDAGVSWRKSTREFGEIRAVICRDLSGGFSEAKPTDTAGK